MARPTAAKAAFNHAIGNMSVHQKDVLFRISPCLNAYAQGGQG